MDGQFERTALMLGEESMKKLRDARVLVFGVGGVGSYTVEALARAGVGSLTLVDNDRVSLSNINRQLIALHSTVGQYKTEAAKARILDICPDTEVICKNMFFLPENADEIDFSEFDYVVDAIDTVSGKLAIAEKCKEAKVPLISSMGTGNKVDPTRFKVADIFKTSVCPLARAMRHELKKRGITKLKVVYSDEVPSGEYGQSEVSDKKVSPASLPFVPSVAGLIIAGEVIKDIAKKE